MCAASTDMMGALADVVEAMQARMTDPADLVRVPLSLGYSFQSYMAVEKPCVIDTVPARCLS